VVKVAGVVVFLVCGVAAGLMPGCATSPGARQESAPGDQRLEPVWFMGGSWEMVTPDGRIEEQWTGAAGGMMLGVSRTIAIAGGSEKTAFFEYLRIEARPEGIVYLASPGGRSPATPFRLIESSRGRAVFENPQHDFPTKISYWLDAGSLHARIEGKQDGKEAAEEWAYKPVARAR
jgi:hypothetical protein